MQLTSVTYTSLSRLDPDSFDLEDIHVASAARNVDAGVTGMLVFNGTHFLHILEGSEEAVDRLVEHIRSDPRHSGFEIRDRQKVAERSFPDWPLALVRVNPGTTQAKEAIASRLPATVPEAIRARLLRMTELISRHEFPS